MAVQLPQYLLGQKAKQLELFVRVLKRDHAAQHLEAGEVVVEANGFVREHLIDEHGRAVEHVSRVLRDAIAGLLPDDEVDNVINDIDDQSLVQQRNPDEAQLVLQNHFLNLAQPDVRKYTEPNLLELVIYFRSNF